jgi:hypothetical protein
MDIVIDSKLQFGSLNHVHPDTLNTDNAFPVSGKLLEL